MNQRKNKNGEQYSTMSKFRDPNKDVQGRQKRKGVERWVRLKASTLGKVVISFYILESIPKHQCILDDLMALMVSKQL
jgi:hypothetical protein